MSSALRIPRNVGPGLILAITLIAGCRKTVAPESVLPSNKVAPQIVNSASVENSSAEDCGLTTYPISRSNEEILADVRRDPKSRYGDMLAKLAIDKNGKITHLRVLRLAHPSARDWKEINKSALDSVRHFHYKPTIYEGNPVAVCSDVSVIVDLF